MAKYGNLELFIDTRAATDIWLGLHQTIREQKTRDTNTISGDEIDPLTFQERDLYDALTRRFTEGLSQ